MALGQAIVRDNRRRRVLQDETRRGGECPSVPVQEGSRYTEAAGVENHPQITQFVPRRFRSYVLGLFLAAAAIALVNTLHLFAGDIERAAGGGPIAAFDLAAGGGLASWFASMVLMVAAAASWMIYTLRRHRVDDYKARYRLWLWVAAAAIAASADSVATLHEPWSSLWVRVTGWSALGGTVWWLAPVGLAGAWLAVRLVLETAECRGACSLVVVGSVAYAIALAAALGALPTGLTPFQPVVVTSALLAGHAFALAGITLYARYVVLDVQGLIVREDAASGRSEQHAPSNRDAGAWEDSNNKADSAPPATLPIGATTTRQRAGRSLPDADEWTDGSDGDGADDEGDHSRQKFSKAQRKRLRKQRRQCA